MMAVSILMHITAPASHVDKRLIVNGKITFSIDSFTLGAASSVSFGSHAGGGAGAGKVNFSSLAIAKDVSPESSFLYTSLCMGLHLEEVTLEVNHSGEKSEKPDDAFYTIKLRTVLIDSFQLSGGIGDHGNPQESWTLAYGAIETAYRPADKTGKLDQPYVATWNQITNSAKFEG